jgi:hypothetical protein
MHYAGSCHCGAVCFEFSGPPIADALRCDCSICRKKGIMLSNFVLPRAELCISASDDAMTIYRFGTGIASHFFCRKCGIAPFAETRLNPGQFRVNLGCVEDLDLSCLKEMFYPGSAI